jgi:site-specific DNA-methyltransferase (adenine-specific)
MKSNFAAIDSGETKTIHDFIERHLEPNEREKKLFGEVFTPLPLVQEMLGSIEKYADKDFWKNPNLKILDPAAGIGNFPMIAYEKLMEGLKSVRGFKEEETRRKHILEKMLYMVELNPNNVRLMNKIFNAKKYKLNVLCTDFLLETNEDVKKHEGLSARQKADGKRLLEWKTMKFDLVMGNPPFNETFNNANNQAKPLYHLFIDALVDECKFLCFVIPSKWLKGSGMGLLEFRHKMMLRKDIRFLKTFEDASEVFGPNINLKGGICYFVKDSNYKGKCVFNNELLDMTKFDVVVSKSDSVLVQKMRKYPNLSDIYIPGSYFDIKSNDKRLKETGNAGNVKCFVAEKRSDKRIQFITSTLIDLDKDTKFWKVTTPEAAHNGKSGFSYIFITKPDTVHNETYISFRVSNEKEAKSLASYLLCTLPNYMLSLRKSTHHIGKNTCKWIPLVPLDRIWTNDAVYKYFDISTTHQQVMEKFANSFPIASGKYLTLSNI